MGDDRTSPHATLGLSTKVEEDFVAPLTALRGSLEILRDFPDLAEGERLRFLETALRGCTRLEQAVKELGDSVYAAGERSEARGGANYTPEEYKRYAERIKVREDLDAIEIDFSDFVFSSSQIVDHFHDAIEELVEASARKWFFIVNYSGCRIWPEAWVAFAHRGKKINVSYSLGTLRYTEPAPGEASAGSAPSSFDPDLFASRELALAKLEELRSQG